MLHKQPGYGTDVLCYANPWICPPHGWFGGTAQGYDCGTCNRYTLNGQLYDYPTIYTKAVRIHPPVKVVSVRYRFAPNFNVSAEVRLQSNRNSSDFIEGLMQLPKE